MKGRYNYVEIHNHNNHHHHVAVVELSLLLTLASLTQPEIPSVAFPRSFCILVCFLLSWVISYEAFFSNVVSNFFCSAVFCPTGVTFNSFVMSVFKLQSVQVCPAVFLIHFIFVAVILLVSVALMVQFSLPYKRAGRDSVLYNLFLFSLKFAVV